MQNRFPLPNDVFFSLCSNLSVQEILSLASTSKEHYKIISTPCLWKNLGARDFYIDFKNDDPKNSYQTLKLGIWREKERFISYMTASNLIMSEVEQEPDYHSIHEEYRQNRKENAIRERLDRYVMQSDESFEMVYESLTSSVQNKRLCELRDEWSKFYVLLMSNNFEDWLNSVANDDDLNEKEKKESWLILNMAFLPLCKLDASISLNTLINKQNLLNKNEYKFCAFDYPCIKTINTLLNLNIALNEKYWVVEGTDRMHIPPIVSAVFGMLEWKNVTTSKEIISLLLRKGADTKLKIFITDDDWKSEEEYNKRSVSIDEWCHWILANKMDKYDLPGDKIIFRETMRMIIDHCPESNLSFSRRF